MKADGARVADLIGMFEAAELAFLVRLVLTSHYGSPAMRDAVIHYTQTGLVRGARETAIDFAVDEFGASEHAALVAAMLVAAVENADVGGEPA